MQVIDKDQFETVARVVAKCNKYIVKTGETWEEVYNKMMALASLEMYTYNHLSVSGFVLSAWDSPDGRRHVSASINSSIMKDFFSL